jgi:tripartite-type tricarboxylate transporter receptor subunit TctC
MSSVCPERLKTLLAACLGIASAIAISNSLADSYPSKPVRILVALSAGSGTDIVVRTVAAKMSENWRQPVVVENRPGAAGAVASSVLVKAEPDGHTLMAYSDGHAVNAALNAANLPYDTLRDIARVSMLANFSTVLVVAPSLGVTSAKELIALAKARPGQLSFGSAGIGGGLHLSGEMFKVAAGIDAVHIPYKGPQEALGDTMSGRVQYMFSPLGPTLPLIRSGRLLPLAVGSAQRSPILSEVPTLAEAALPGFEYDLWSGLFAPARTPRAILEQISQEVARVMNLPDVKEQLMKLGLVYRPNTPDEFDRLVRADVEKLSNVGKLAGIKLQ